MPATVTHLDQYRATHPPILRLWNANCRLVAGWIDLNLQLTMALFRILMRRN